jgi:hypothetical protein
MAVVTQVSTHTHTYTRRDREREREKEKNFSENYQFGHILSKSFTSVAPGQKSLKNIGFKGC